MNQKAFSLIEIIFVLLIMGIIITLAVSKFETTLNRTNINKIKSDIIQIRAGINLYKNKLILENKKNTFDTLDDNNKILFSKVLKKPIISSHNNSAKSWRKISDTKYKVYVDKKNFIEFSFDTQKYTFDCNIKNILCKELNL